MNTVQKVAKNSGIIIGSHILDTLINLAMLTSLARYFGQSGFGKLSFLGVFFFFIGSSDNLLIRPILVREMARDKINAASIVGNGLLIRAIFSLAAIAICWLTIWIIKPSSDIIQLAFFSSIGLLMSSVVCSYETIFQINLSMGYYKAINILCSIAVLFVLFGVIFFKGSLLHFNIFALIPGAISLLLIRRYSGRFMKPKFAIDFALWKKIFKDSWPLLLTSIFIFIYHRLDQVMLLKIKGPEAVGTYSVAVKLAEIFNIVPVALKVSLLPLLSEYFRISKGTFEKVYQISFKYLLMFIIPVAMFITIFSKSIISLFFGAQFLSSGIALSILIWAEVFVFMGVINNAILIASDKQILDPFFTGISAAVNIFLNVMLIPRYGIAGAAIASFLSYPVGPIAGYFIKTTRAYSRCMFYYSLRPLFASLLIAAFIYFSSPHYVMAAALSPFIYFLAMYFFKGINRNDVLLLKSIIST